MRIREGPEHRKDYTFGYSISKRKQQGGHGKPEIRKTEVPPNSLAQDKIDQIEPPGREFARRDLPHFVQNGKNHTPDYMKNKGIPLLREKRMNADPNLHRLQKASRGGMRNKKRKIY